MKILITGATGYIGSHLALKLANKGHIVHLLCRSMPEKQLRSHHNSVIFMGDITSKHDIQRAILGCDQVYHLAAFARVWAKDNRCYYNTNILGTKNLLDCAQENGINRFVFTSTGGVFGPSDGTALHEYSKQAKPFPNAYASSKLKAERLVKDAASSGLDAVTVNPTRVYGPGLKSKSNAVTEIIEKYCQGRWHVIPGDGSLIANYAYIKDVVDGHIAAMKYGWKGERYILGGQNISYNRLFDIIKKETGLSYPMHYLPLPVIKALSVVDLLSAKIQNKIPSITPAWVNGMRHNALRTCSKAEKEIGYTITPIESGIRQTVDWIRMN